MGYYTYFANHDTKLDRDLTEDELAEFTKLCEPYSSWWEIERKEISWINEAFLCIWDEDSMKAYDWRIELKSILDLFSSFWIKVNGSISWEGEESHDVWECIIKDNQAILSNLANVSDIISHLKSIWFDEAAKSIEYYYCEKL